MEMKMVAGGSCTQQRPLGKHLCKRFRESKYLLILFLPTALYFLIFSYAPMFGLVIAFKDYNLFQGIAQSDWVGFKYFKMLFVNNPDFWPLMLNTLRIGLYSFVFGFPAPILFALLLNEVTNLRFKKLVQTVSYLPHFLSNVIVASMILMFLSPDDGMVNVMLQKLGMQPIYFMSKPEFFVPVYIISGLWQEIGWGTIIYLAAIAGVDPNLYEAAELDGCNRWQKMWHVTLPGIANVIIVLSILNIGGIMGTSFEKVLLLSNPATYSVSEIFSTYTYKIGMEHGNFSYATAVGIFNGVVSFILVVGANFAAKKWRGSSLW